MKRYLLDTCVLTWYLDEHKRAKDIAEDIEYFQGDFAVSIETVKEFVYLIQSGKIGLDYDFDEFTTFLSDKYINLLTSIWLAWKSCFRFLFTKITPTLPTGTLSLPLSPKIAYLFQAMQNSAFIQKMAYCTLTYKGEGRQFEVTEPVEPAEATVISTGSMTYTPQLTINN